MEEVTSPVARLHGIHDMRLEDAADENGTRQYSALGHGVESTTRPGKRQGDQQLPADPLPRRRSLRLLNRKNNQSAEQEVAAVDDNVQEEKKEEEDFAVVISAGESQLDNGQRRSRRDLNVRFTTVKISPGALIGWLTTSVLQRPFSLLSHPSIFLRSVFT